MKEDLPDITYERSMNHNYMILSKCDFFDNEGDRKDDFRTRMLLENDIPGLLPVTHRLVNSESRYYYEINSMQSLDRLYDKNEIGYEELKKLLSGCVSLFERLEEYLLDGTQIIIKPQFIYINVEKMEPYFVCYPDYEGDVRLSFMEFIDELLTKIDHNDERAVMLGYKVYRYTRNPNYVISEIDNIMEHSIADMAVKTCINTDYMENMNMESEAGDLHVNCYDESEANYDIGYNDEAGMPYEYGTGKNSKKADIRDLIGAVFCMLVSLCAGAIILGARLLRAFKLSEDNELYLCGAIAMAFVAAVLFMSCYIKKRKQDREMDLLNIKDEEAYEEPAQAYSCTEHNQLYFKPDISDMCKSDNHKSNKYKSDNNDAGETVCLSDSRVEERVLIGRMNGREVNISLERLPMTVGKQANVSDFVINDTAVSKMHARFEERDGRVFVCDLNSTNGTVRNGVMLGINQPVALEPGDRLRFGRTCFTYC